MPFWSFLWRLGKPGLLLSSLLLLQGCPRTDQVRHTKLSPKAVSQVLAKIRAERAQIKGLEGSAKLRVYHNGKRKQTIRMMFQLQRPDRLHLQVKAAFGQPAVIITCDGKEFAIHNLLQKRFTKGPATRLISYLREYLPVPLPLGDLVSVLLGELPLLPASTQKITAAKEKGVAIMERKGNEWQQKVWLDVRQARFLKTTVQRKGSGPVTLEYGTFRGKPALPKRIKFILPQRATRVSWIFVRQQANTKIPNNSFQQETPAGVPVHRVP